VGGLVNHIALEWLLQRPELLCKRDKVKSSSLF
jgi:hypothetical protein